MLGARVLGARSTGRREDTRDDRSDGRREDRRYGRLQSGTHLDARDTERFASTGTWRRRTAWRTWRRITSRRLPFGTATWRRRTAWRTWRRIGSRRLRFASATWRRRGPAWRTWRRITSRRLRFASASASASASTAASAAAASAWRSNSPYLDSCSKTRHGSGSFGTRCCDRSHNLSRIHAIQIQRKCLGSFSRSDRSGGRNCYRSGGRRTCCCCCHVYSLRIIF